MRWTAKDIENLKVKNGINSDVKLVKNKPTTLKTSKEKEAIKTVLFILNKKGIIPEYTSELKFHNKRKFKFDWAIPSLKIAIEYEGIFSKKSRHTTVNGFTKDTIKYNLATVNGWKILRYTAINYANLEHDLTVLVEKSK